MADVHDKATRSKNMRAIATRDTAIEKRLASLLTGQGLAFRVQDASLPRYQSFAGTRLARTDCLGVCITWAREADG